jgi:hypothetical protein
MSKQHVPKRPLTGAKKSAEQAQTLLHGNVWATELVSLTGTMTLWHTNYFNSGETSRQIIATTAITLGITSPRRKSSGP